MTKKRNTREKGAQAVRVEMKLWEEQGYFTWKPGNKAVYIPGRGFVSQSQDIMKVADFIAIKCREKIRFVQGTYISGSTSNAQVRMRKFDAIIDKLPLQHCIPTIMAKVPGTSKFRTWQLEESRKWKEITWSDTMPWLPEIKGDE